ncbi:MAG: flagellar biosynthetic protein FliO [Planctomycetes bacterium]|nr:flagellar biosynthetic protein FliO [Planctomycetota bacterium]
MRIYHGLLIVLVCFAASFGLAQGSEVSETTGNDLGMPSNEGVTPSEKTTPTDPSKTENLTESGDKTGESQGGLVSKTGLEKHDQANQGRLDRIANRNLNNEETSFTDGIGEVFLYLGLFTIGIVAVVFFIRRTPRLRRMLSGGPIKVVSRAYLGPRTAIHLVKVGERVLVIGQSPDGLRTLSEITDNREITRLLHEASEVAPESMSNTFKSALRSASISEDSEPAARTPTAKQASPAASTFEATVGDDDDEGISVDPGYSSQLKLAALRAKFEKEQATQ